MRAVLVAFSACLLLAPASAEDHVTAVTDGDWEATIVDGPWMVELCASSRPPPPVCSTELIAVRAPGLLEPGTTQLCPVVRPLQGVRAGLGRGSGEIGPNRRKICQGGRYVRNRVCNEVRFLVPGHFISRFGPGQQFKLWCGRFSVKSYPKIFFLPASYAVDVRCSDRHKLETPYQ